jgi:hypothetical protein
VGADSGAPGAVRVGVVMGAALGRAGGSGARRGSDGGDGGGVRGERRRCVAAVNDMNGSRSRGYVKFTFFGECPRSGNRQRYFFNLKIHFVEYPGSDTRQRLLCRVPTDKHSTKNKFRVFKIYFVECPMSDTWHNMLCRMPFLDTRQSIFLFFIFLTKLFVVCCYTM